ncbi:glutaminase A [Aphanomyces invadans]|uniref:glutaminase n=1 Tax=Aphanomyces invadans TaxID=157072 RepID=A0A024UKE6_9STRA|nr:glutaminase A [Aphanomyces invadans]ETW06665.1 glutaminase A [Aphanomyces invadans]|eukprot:XP_008864740.1 glutaminase A [Aphanomyces invadans]
MATRRQSLQERPIQFDQQKVAGSDESEETPLSRRIFEFLDQGNNGVIRPDALQSQFDKCGLRTDDPRIATLCDKLKANPSLEISIDVFDELTNDSCGIIEKGFTGQFCIPNFDDFRSRVDRLVEETCRNAGVDTKHNTADANTFVVSMCTVDGQRHVSGNQDELNVEICMEGCCKPILYGMAMESNPGIDNYISHEPSGLDSHATSLQLKDKKRRPHNPLMNTGALLSCALLGQPGQTLIEKHQLYEARLNNLFSRTPQEQPRRAVSLEEKKFSSRNMSLSYMLDDAKCFPPNTDVDEVVQLFFRACAATCSVDELSLFAAMLANGGLHPITKARIMQAQSVRQCLSVMFSCGLGTYSGEWSFHVGIPALSSLGGAMLVVVPGLMGFCSFSPTLDRSNNSVNGVEFFRALSRTFTFHNFDSLPMINFQRKDPRRDSRTIQVEMTTKLLIAAAEGDVCEVRRLRSRGANLDAMDYDSRTALHLAASEGKIRVVNYLIKHHVHLSPVDRWGGTPMSDAITFGHLHVAQLLTKAGVITNSTKHAKTSSRFKAKRPVLLQDMSVFYAAYSGDLQSLKVSFGSGLNFAALRDYDGRTPLHVAAAEGRLDVVKFLISTARVPILVKDRNRNTPISEAKRGGHAAVLEFMRKQLQTPATESKRHFPVHTVPQTPRHIEENSDDELEEYEVSSHSAFQFLAMATEDEVTTDDAKVNVSTLITTLRQNGLLEDDPRLKKLVESVKFLGADATLSVEQYRYLTESGAILLERALAQSLIIPRFNDFCDELIDIFEAAKLNQDGHIATYIPQLANVDPEKFGMALCTVDGQRFSLGDAKDPFCVQSCSKAISYCLAVEELGVDKVHFHMGCEPSGLRFNDLSLLDRGGSRVPHNPMINSGAIMSSSLIRRDLPLHQRFEHIMQTWKALCGDTPVGFDNSVCLSERSSADRNWCLGYMMREAECLPDDTNLAEALEFYFEQCSLTTSCESFSVLAASLASGGVCPLTNHRVFEAETVKNCLSLMFSCGMYDASGTWGYSVGIPAKSGVSGVLLLVIPNVLGLAVWSPRLDEIGNSVRGVQFCQELVKRFPFHNFDPFVEHLKKPSPVYHAAASDCTTTDPKMRRKLAYQLLYAAYEGNVEEVRRLKLHGASVHSSDYDGRTAMHIAASMGHVAVVRELLRQGADVRAIDRWGGTPLTDAERYAPSNAGDVVTLLQNALTVNA